MTPRWAWRRLITAAVAVLMAPVIASVFSLSGAQGANPPTPVMSFSAPSSAMIGESVAFDVSFTNTSATAAGYGPYVDLRLPLGADGNDGLTFTSATYLGAAVTTTQLVADGSGCVTHPYAVQLSGAPVQVCGLAAGQSYVVMRLPFGSFTPGQPAAAVHVTTHLSNLADAGTALTIGANGGFQFGADPLSDPAVDPSTLGSVANTTMTPTIMRITKTYNGPENETATGPNFPHSYTINVTIAPGQTVGNLVVSDALPASVQYLSTTTPTTPASAPVATPSTSTPGGTLSRNFGSVTGTGGIDATMTFQFYVPRVDSGSGVILPAVTGAFNTSTDNATANATWTPIDIRDTAGPVSAGPATHALTDKSIAVQKSVGLVTDTGPAGVSPGDTLEWTISVQASDYFAFNGVTIDDLLGDGTRVDGGFTPTLAVTNNGSNSAAAAFHGPNYTVSAVNGLGQTPISFRLSDELVARGQNGRVVGGCVNPVSGTATPDCISHDAGPTTATIVLRSIVQQTYVNGTSQVVEGDTLVNQAAATAAVLNTGTFASTGNTIGDGSAGVATAGASASISIDRGTLTKTIYAINGSTSFAQPVHISPGDAVTYRLQQTFPTSRTDDFRMTDYLPLPIFYAAGVSTFDATGGAAAPAAGHAKYGPTDTFHALAGAPTPVVSSDITANSVQFAYGDYALYPPDVSTADILFTVTVSTDPFADGLMLTNQARSQTKNAIGTIQTADAIVQLTLDQPVLTITKGIVGSDHGTAAYTPATTGPVTFTAPASPPAVGCPGWSGGAITSAGLAAHPIDSNVAGLDAGDYVRFAITIHNTGHAAAFQVKVADTLPADLVVPAGGIDLCAANGAGTPLATTNIGGGAGLFDQGVQLTDPGAGALAAGVSSAGVTNATGTDIVVLTYTLRVATTAVPKEVVTNTASLLDFTNDPGASGHMSAPMTDDATVTMRPPAAAKIVAATNRAYTLGNDAVIGEIVTYTVTLTIPEGTIPAASVVDTLPAGLAFVDCSSINASPGITTSLAGGFGSACNAPVDPTVGAGGQLVTFGLGDVTNADTNNAVTETIAITYRAVVLNLDTNVRGRVLHNGAVLSWTGGTIAAVSAADVRVVEPDLFISKTPSTTVGDAGDTITYTIVVSNPVDAAGADAFDVYFHDQIPAGLTYSGGTWIQTAGLPADNIGGSGSPFLTADWATFPQGSTATFQYSVTIDATVVPKQSMVNDAWVYWSSLPGDYSATQSNYNTVGDERSENVGNPGWIANDYSYEAMAPIDVPSATVAKTMTATNLADTTGSNVAVGEVVTYRLVVTLPEGTQPSAALVDTLPAGLAFKDCVGIVNSNPADVTTTLGADFSSACASDGSNPTPGVNGQHVTFNLGSITNANRDNGTAETLTITYRAVVLNVASNNRGKGLTNGAVFSWTGGSSSAGTSSVNVVEPIMTVTKTRNPVAGDAGDTITYTVTIANPTNANQATAYNVAWSDTIPAGMTYVPGSLQRNSGNVPDAIGSTGVNGENLSASWATYAASGSTTVLQYSVTLDASVTPGQTLTNSAAVTWMSLPDSVAGDAATSYNALGAKRTGNTSDPGGAANTYKAVNSVVVTITQPAPIKTIATTSEAGTANPYAAIGEVVRFRVAVTVPEGSFPLASIYDNLPLGLQYVNDGTATVAFVSNGGGAGLTSDAIGPGAGLQVTGDTTWAGDPTFAIPGGQITGGPFVNGTDPIFNLGNLTNADRDPDGEMVVIEFNAVVENIAGNTRNTNLSNTAAIRKNGATLATSVARVVTVAEPGITYNFSYTTIPVDGGDTIVYRITITNASGASYSPAYDFHATDAINANVAVSSIVPAGPGTWTDNSNTGTGTVDVTFDAIAPGTSNTITITGQVIDAVDAGKTIPNTAFATWTSLPGTGGTLSNTTGTNTPGAAGAATGERTGSGIAPNTYDTNFTNPITLAVPSISKLGPTPATASVGGNTTFDLVVTLPEGTTRGLTVVDTLPAGLIPVGYNVVTSAAASGTRLTNDYPGTLNVVSSVPPSGSTGGAWTITFGDTYLPPDSTANNSFLLQITAQVANISGNQAGVVRTNSASLKYTQGGVQTVPAPLPRFVTVTEPTIGLTKSANNTNPRFGDVVTYTLAITNPTVANGADAHDVVLTDVLPAGLTYVPASLTNTAGVAPTSTSIVGGTITIDFDTLAMPAGSTFQYQATVGDSSTVALKQTLTNNARVTWTSQLGAVAEERTGADGPGGLLNDYAAATTAPVTVGGVDLVLSKTDGQINAVAGQVLTYTLNYQNAGSETANGVVITETVPTNTIYTGSGWTCAGGGVAGSTCTVPIGSVNSGAGSSATFVVTVVDPIPSGSTQIVNTASIADDHGKNADPTPADNTATDTDAIPQIDLSLTKTVDDPTPDPNQVVAFTITVSNAGPAQATNVKVADVLPVTLAYVSSSPSQGSFVPGTGVWAVGTILNGGNATLTVNARVISSTPGTNSAQVTRADQADVDSTPGNGPGEDDYATATVTPNISDLAIAKVVDNGHPDVGSDVTFTITATNNGPVADSGVNVTDILPAGLTYKSSSATKGSYNSGSHVWTVGGVASGANEILTLVATVNASGPITNTATVAGVSYDPDLSNNTASTSADQLVDLAVAKTVDHPTANVGSNATFTVDVSNLGPGTATGVVIQDAVPAGLTWISDSAGQGTYDHSTGVWAVGAIGAGEKATLTVTGNVATPSPVTNTASVTSVDEPQASTANDSASATVTPPHADLAVVKSVSEPRPEQGDSDTFTIALTNRGPNDATNVAVTDQLPAGLTFVSSTATAGTYDDATGIWTVASLANGGTETLTVVATVVNAADYLNTATVTQSDQYDPDPSNNSGNASLSTRIADIAITKVANNSAPAVGSTVQFTVTATNNGPDNATQLVIHDALPAGLTYVASTPEAGTYDPNTGLWSVGNLANGGTVTLTINARVVGSGSISNTASVSGLLQRDSDHGNDSATAALDVPPAADLSLTKTVDVASPDLNTNVTFTVTVTNHGPNGAAGVHVQDILPAGLTYVSGAPSAGTYDPSSGDWAVGGVANGASETLAVVTTVTVEGPITNMAQVSASSLPDPDSTPGNDAVGEDDQAAAALNTVGVADLSLVAQVKSSDGIVGGQAVYELVLHNAGPEDASHVIVRDQLPAGVTFVSSSGGTYDSKTGAWTVGNIGNGSSATLYITVRIGRAGPISNTSEVAASDQRDPNSTPNDNVASENDQSTVLLSANKATPPPTNTPGHAPGPGGEFQIWSLIPGLLGFAMISRALVLARNHAFRDYE